MIDIRILRENPQLIKKNIERKGQDYKLSLVDKDCFSKSVVFGLFELNKLFLLFSEFSLGYYFLRGLLRN